MNNENTQDFSKLRNDLKKMTLKIFASNLFSYLIGLTIVSFIYPFVDESFNFNIGFVISVSFIFAIIRGVDFYLSGNDVISSHEVVSIFKDVT